MAPLSNLALLPTSLLLRKTHVQLTELNTSLVDKVLKAGRVELQAGKRERKAVLLDGIRHSVALRRHFSETPAGESFRGDLRSG